jgi:hypothetical protein
VETDPSAEEYSALGAFGESILAFIEPAALECVETTGEVVLDAAGGSG